MKTPQSFWSRILTCLAAVSFCALVVKAETISDYSKFGTIYTLTAVTSASASTTNFHQATFTDYTNGTEGTAYYGDTTYNSLLFWRNFTSAFVETFPTVRFAAASGSAMDASFTPITFGGMIVEDGATGWSLTGSTYTRATELGTTGADSYFAFGESFSIERTGATTLRGNVHMQMDSGVAFSI